VSRWGGNPVLGLAEAREIAKEALNLVALGINPRQGKEVSPKSHAFEDVVEEFVRLRRNRKRTREETELILRTNSVSRWKRRDVRDISRNDVLDVLDRSSNVAHRSGPTTRSRPSATASTGAPSAA
jgi:hypothetical protein